MTLKFVEFEMCLYIADLQKNKLIKMKKVIGFLFLSILLIQCGQDKDTLIIKNQLGNIDKNTTIEELDKIFKNDSNFARCHVEEK